MSLLRKETWKQVWVTLDLQSAMLRVFKSQKHYERGSLCAIKMELTNGEPADDYGPHAVELSGICYMQRKGFFSREVAEFEELKLLLRASSTDERGQWISGAKQAALTLALAEPSQPGQLAFLPATAESIRKQSALSSGKLSDVSEASTLKREASTVGALPLTKNVAI